jgi:peptidyl-prolyl cis-trans isomerase D
MLQNIRSGTKGPVFKVIIGLIVLSFALFGVESILLGGSDDSVAEINGEKVSAFEVQQAVARQKQSLAELLGDNFRPELFDEQQLTQQALQGIIATRLQQQWAASWSLTASDKLLGELVASIPSFQIDGVFSPELYTQSLAMAGFTPLSFKEALKSDEMVRQLTVGLLDSELTTPLERDVLALVNGEQRSVRYAMIPRGKVTEQVVVSESDIVQYFEANADAFTSEERVSVNYLHLKSEDYFEPVDEGDLRAAYELEINDYAYESETRVSHVLLIQGDDESSEEYASRVERVASSLNSGESFADVAMSQSDDIGSSSDGGDLGYTNGELFPQPMEDAIASLELNEISGPVVTDAGTHFLLVTDRRSEEPPSFEEMRGQLEVALAESDARRRLVSQVERLRDLAYTAPNLSDPAAELGLTVLRAEKLSRTKQEGVFVNEAVMNAVFSEALVVDGYNSDVLEISEDEFVALRVTEHFPPAALELDAVREDIQATLQYQAELDALVQLADRLAAELSQGVDLESLAQREGLEWQVVIDANRQSGEMDRDWVGAVFSAPASDLPLARYELLANGDAVLFQLFRVKAGSEERLGATTLERSQQAHRRLLQRVAQGAVAATLEAEAEIQVYQ